jgi:xylitol oxidase
MGLTNWAGNVVFSVDRVHRPSSVRELQDLVARSRRVRVLGSGHSFNTLADTDDVLVSVESIRRPLVVDREAGTVTVGAGVRYTDLARSIDEVGLALANLGSLPHISVGGAVATATHGSGTRNGNLATAVSALELLTAAGEVLTLRRDVHDDRFDGAVVALGALGVVVALTLAIVPAYEVRQWVYEGLGWDELTEHLDEVFAKGYSVSVFTGWRDEWTGQVWVKRRTDDRQELESELFGARLASEPRNPVPGMPVENCTPQLGVAGRWHERLPHFRAEFTPSAGDELQSEYLVPRANAIGALEALAEVRSRIWPVLQIGELRTVASDELWLSPSYRRDVLGIHFTWVKDSAAVLPAIRVVEEALAPFEACPHWGKLFSMPAPAVRSRYPRLAEFQKLVDEFDPRGKFRNGFVERYLTA